ncbi:hypothetical protein [Tabrizicola soli]|uniref:Uncharacterized protein n=1 Tax=Tabrizicola soli TaxID=2185115 RepID=A0ABV7DUI1_9RHOB|nr:hypothetical protein [Tabrizicola soli]
MALDLKRQIGGAAQAATLVQVGQLAIGVIYRHIQRNRLRDSRETVAIVRTNGAVWPMCPLARMRVGAPPVESGWLDSLQSVCIKTIWDLQGIPYSFYSYSDD